MFICQKGGCNNLVPFSTAEGVVRHIRFDGTRDVYWAVEDLGTIRHKDPLSGPIGTLVSGETAVYGLAIYQPTVYFTRREVAGKLKKVDTNADANSLVELAANLNMPEGVATLAVAQANPSGIWVDQTHVYWANAAKPGAILRIAKP